MKAGVAQTIITPPLGLDMHGWASRAAGHNRAVYVHDDLFVKALFVEDADNKAAIAVLDIGGIDALFVDCVRKKVCKAAGMEKESILISATHCHSAPAIRPTACSCSSEDFKNNSVSGDGTIKTNEQKRERLKPSALGVDDVSPEWREKLICRTADTIIAARAHRQQAKLSYGEAEISSVASSRRVYLANGEWGDPRGTVFNEEDVVHRTEIDPFVRNIFIHSEESGNLIGVFVNYGTHPWLLSISGYSAELPGAVSRRIAENFADIADQPVILYTTAPLGDVTLIWNLDIKSLWQRKSGESNEESLKYREQAFDRELERLSGYMLDGIKNAYINRVDKTGDGLLNYRQKQIFLPFKEGYSHVAEVTRSEAQKAVTDKQLTELQYFSLGGINLLSLPGEPFTSIGLEIRNRTSIKPLIIVAHANDAGCFQYVADAEEARRGGYELSISTLAENAGDILIDEAVDFLK